MSTTLNTSIHTAQASPNIAFIKYWGKIKNPLNPSYPEHWVKKNIGINPSLSMTLSNARTTTSIQANPELTSDVIELNGQITSTEDQEKISQHLDFIAHYWKTPRIFCRVSSHNNFPLGTGLASSASGFAALSLAGTAALRSHQRAQELLGPRLHDFSILSRVGSGSAARSVAAYYMQWDGEAAWPIAQNSWILRDTVIMFSKEKKKVSSREGHQLALNSPLLAQRLEALPGRLQRVQTGLQNRDLKFFGPTLEEEALELHAIAESSQVRYHTDDSQRFVDKLHSIKNRDFFFTLDAGPNVHIISERDVSVDLNHLLQELGINAELWLDQTGASPSLENSAENSAGNSL